MSSQRSFVSSAKLIAVCTLLSRVTGLLRDVLLAQTFGLSWVQDAFSYAFQLPNLFRRLFGEGAMAPAFVPTFSHVLEQEGREAAWRLLARTFTLLTVVLVVVMMAIAACIVVISLLPVSAAQAGPRALLLNLTLIMLPFMLSICLVALLSSILNCLGSFVPAAVAPIVLNFCMIAALVWLGPTLYPGHPEAQVFVTAWSVLIAGGLQLVLLWPVLRHYGVRVAWRWDPGDPTVKRLLQLFGPITLGQGILAFGVFMDAQVCTLLTNASKGAGVANWFGLQFAYPLQEGALSALTCAQRLYQFPLGVLVISLATAALPSFSRLAAQGDWPTWNGQVRQALRLALFEGVMAGALMVVLAIPIVRLLFERGKFTPADSVRAGHILLIYGLSMWSFCAQHIVTRAFYSVGDARTPLRIAVALLPVNLALSVCLVWMPTVREAAFAWSTAATSATAVIWGLICLERRNTGRIVDRAFVSAASRMLFAGAVAAAAVWFAQPHVLAAVSGLHGYMLPRAIHTLGLLASGMLLYLLVARLLGVPEVASLLSLRRRR